MLQSIPQGGGCQWIGRGVFVDNGGLRNIPDLVSYLIFSMGSNGEWWASGFSWRPAKVQVVQAGIKLTLIVLVPRVFKILTDKFSL